MKEPKRPTPHNEDAPRDVEELFLLHLRYKEARLIENAANQPLLLTDEALTWVVYAGHVDLFFVHLEQNRPTGSRLHCMRLYPGQALFAIEPPPGRSVALMAVGTQHTRLLQVPTQRFVALIQDEAFRQPIRRMFDDWVAGLSKRLASTLPPKDCLRLSANQTVALPARGAACSGQTILWVNHQAGYSHFMGNRALPRLNGRARWPISNRTWLEPTDSGNQLHAIDTAAYLEDASIWTSMRQFNALVLEAVALEEAQRLERVRDDLQRRQRGDRALLDTAFEQLASPLTAAAAPPAVSVGAEDALLEACRLVGTQLGIEIVAPPGGDGDAGRRNPLELIARASRLRVRQVMLSGAWWAQDHGPMVGFLPTEAAEPRWVALLPKSVSSYVMVDPRTGERAPVSADLVDQLAPTAFVLYRPFPAQAMTLLSLFKFGLRGNFVDASTLLLAGLAVSLLGLLVPIGTAFLFDSIIPNAATSQLVQVALALGVIAVATGLFQATQNLAVLRVQGRVGAVIQASVWDRLLSLPVSFFRDYTAGDLGIRAMSIDSIQQTLSTTALRTLLSGCFSISSFGLLFYYNAQLALVALLLVLVAVAATVAAGAIQLRFQRQILDRQGIISGQVLQTITGMRKLRAAGAESRAFMTWAIRFGELQRLAFRARDVGNRFAIFNSTFTIVTSMVIFGTVAFTLGQSISTGTFLGFNAAFGQFLAGVMGIGSTIVTIMVVMPTYERARPILETLPESDELKRHPGELHGALELSHVSFRYAEDGPRTLNDLSLRAEPGEFVAIVGPSGAGKSTVVRMLLGFETPDTGEVLYDGNPLHKLDVLAVRRQIGVVLQDGQILGGSLFRNIVGSSTLTLDDAWAAARMAGLAEDIEAMPMKMHTIVSSGGGTLSGGQRQRLLIARALAHRPRILLFDEATSALDNQTQKVVNDSIENLQATRIVIAHRLSTIVNADRIYVLDKGRVAEAGTYEELIDRNGLFAQLARRQGA